MRPLLEAAGGEGGWAAQGMQPLRGIASIAPPSPCSATDSLTLCLLLCAPGHRLYQDGTLKLLGRLSLLSEEILWAANGLPNPFCSSDHLCLLASFGMEVSAP